VFDRATITLGIGPHSSLVYLWPSCEADADIMFCPVVSSIFFIFFPRLISAVTEWMSTIHGVALVRI